MWFCGSRVLQHLGSVAIMFEVAYETDRVLG